MIFSTLSVSWLKVKSLKQKVKTPRAEAAIVQLAHILGFIQRKLHRTAGAFGVRVGLAHQRIAAALASYDFVFMHCYASSC